MQEGQIPKNEEEIKTQKYFHEMIRAALLEDPSASGRPLKYRPESKVLLYYGNPGKVVEGKAGVYVIKLDNGTLHVCEEVNMRAMN